MSIEQDRLWSQQHKPNFQTDSASNQRFIRSVARALGGAIIFSLPLLMTMEMWWLGFYMDRLRLALMMILLLPLLVMLSHYIGFETTLGLKDDLLDALVAYAVGFTSSAITLMLLGVFDLSMSVDEWIGKISIQAVPSSIGALLAQSEFSTGKAKRTEEHYRYSAELFFMTIGALFLALSVAPTEEIIQIAFRLAYWQAIILIIASLICMHAFVYSVEFKGESTMPKYSSPISLFLRFTLVGYMIAMLISAYVLWSFGRTDNLALEEILLCTIVLGFPAAIGAASARLVL